MIVRKRRPRRPAVTNRAAARHGSPTAPTAPSWQPSRREAVAGLAAGLGSLAAPSIAPSVARAQARQGRAIRAGIDAPNVLLFTMDDAQWQTLGVFGGPVAGATPHLDAFAARAVTFRHAHSTIAECWPLRAALMTGRYPHRNGSFHFHRLTPGIDTLPEALRRAGYFTGVIGKAEHTIPYRGWGAFNMLVRNNRLDNGRSPEKFRELFGRGVRRAREAGRPFFLNVNSHDPHRPFPGQDSADDWKAYVQYAADSLGLADALGSQRLRWQGNYPPPIRVFSPDEIVVPPFLPDLPGVRQDIADYYTGLYRGDAAFGACLAVLEELGLREQTLVIFMSDHGMAAPFAKATVYPNGTRCSLMMAGPGVAGSRMDERTLVEAVDLAPTLLELAGLPPFRHIDGRSMTAALGAPQPDHRRHAATFMHSVFTADFPSRALNGPRYTYIYNDWADGNRQFQSDAIASPTFQAMRQAAKTDPAVRYRAEFYRRRTMEELYDNDRDEGALDNLIDAGAEAERVAGFRAALLAQMQATDDPLLGRYEVFLAGRQAG